MLFNNNNADPPSIHEVKLISSNKEMAHVKLPNGKDVTVKIEDLSPILDVDENYLHNQDLIELDTIPENTTLIEDLEDTDVEKSSCLCFPTV